MQGGVYVVVGGARPVVDGDGDVVNKAAVAGVVKIDEACDLVAVEQYVVFEQIGVDDAAGQIGIGALGEIGDFILQ